MANPLKMLTALLDRVGLANLAGLQMDGNRDLYTVFGWKRQIDHHNFVSKYLRQDIASRIVDAPVTATWRNPPKVIFTEPGAQAIWDKLITHGTIWNFLARADRLAGLGRYSVLLIGFDDGAEFKNAVTPNKERKVLYMQPYGEGHIEIRGFESNVHNPRFGKPSEYVIKTVDPAEFGESVQQFVGARNLTVHHSRILHVAPNPLESDIVGNPMLARIFNLLDDLLKLVGGAAETFWLAGNRGLHADIDKDMEVNPNDAEALAGAIDEYQNQLRRVLRTRGVSIKSLGSETPDPTGMFDVIMSLISGTTGIPRRILLGSEAGQLASEQDRANWAERIKERRGDFAQPHILLPFINMLMQAGVLPESDFEIEWSEAFHLSPLEEATTMSKRAQATRNLSTRGQAGDPLITENEAREILGYDPLPEGTTLKVKMPDQGPNASESEEEEEEEDDTTASA